MGKVGPRSTPTYSDGKIYAQGATGTLMCLNADDGKLNWQIEIEELVSAESISKQSVLNSYSYQQEPRLYWGRSASPLVVDDLVITTGGGPDDEHMVSMLAFDKKTGDEKWRGGSDMIAYGSPSLATLNGIRQILLIGEKSAFGVAVDDGHTLWSHEWKGTSNGDANCDQVTVVSENQVLLTKGYSHGAELIQLDPDGDAFSVTSVWRNPRALVAKFNNPVVRDDHAYAISNNFLQCVRLADGEVIWRFDKAAKNGQLLLVGDKLLVQTEFGKLWLFEASPAAPKRLGEIDSVGGICWNTLGISGLKVVARSNVEMTCFELPGTLDGSENH
ncbi:MAG: PQQ-binding-like beta-propeller repeat protein [Pirellulaceae bacterium]